MKNLKVYIVLMISMILWGGSFVWSKEALQNFGVYTIVFFRLLISAVVLFLYGGMIRKSFKLARKDIPLFLLLSFFEPFLYFIGETNGLKTVSPTITSVLISTIPIFIIITAYFLYKDKLKLLNIIGAIVSFIGVLFILINKDFEFNSPISGIMLIFLAVFSATGYSLVIQKLSGKYSPLVIVAYQSLLAIPAFFLLFMLNDFNEIVFTDITFSKFLPIIKLGILASSLAYIFFAYGIKYIGVSKAGLFSNTIPLFTAIFSYFLFDERLDNVKYFGMFLVVLGLYLSQQNSEYSILKSLKKFRN